LTQVVCSSFTAGVLVRELMLLAYRSLHV